MENYGESYPGYHYNTVWNNYATPSRTADVVESVVENIVPFETDTSAYDRPFSDEDEQGQDSQEHGRGGEQDKVFKETGAFGDLVAHVTAIHEVPDLTKLDEDPIEVAARQLVIDPWDLERDWNNDFQLYYESELCKFDDVKEVTKQLKQLNDDFVRFSGSVAHRIVSDLPLPEARRQFHPVAEQKGIAGGLKYRVGNVFFKYATDVHGLYGGSYAAAQKAACNEIRAINSIVDAKLPDLHVTLTALFFYRGHCIIAIAHCPINQGADTLVYGSCDQGRSYRNSSPQFEELMNTLAGKMNLARHKLAFQDAQGRLQQVQLATAGDVEGHFCGVDQRFYLIDLARHIPPVPPRQNTNDHMFLQFRPEFVQKAEQPLSSDVFSGFGKIDGKLHEANAHAMFDRLRRENIPAFAKSIQDIVLPTDLKAVAMKSCASAVRKKSVNMDELSDVLNLELDFSKYCHKRGINIRYLGQVLACLDESQSLARRIVLRQMTNRCIKSWSFKCMHALSGVFLDDHAFLAIVAHLIGALTSAHSPETAYTWNVQPEQLVPTEECPRILWDDQRKVDDSFWRAMPWILRDKFGELQLSVLDLVLLRQSYSLTAPPKENAIRQNRVSARAFLDMTEPDQTACVLQHFRRPLMKRLLQNLGLEMPSRTKSPSSLQHAPVPVENVWRAAGGKKNKMKKNRKQSLSALDPDALPAPPLFARTYSDVLQNPEDDGSVELAPVMANEDCPGVLEEIPFMAAFYRLGLQLKYRCKRVRNPDLNRIDTAERTYSSHLKHSLTWKPQNMQKSSTSLLHMLSSLYEKRDRDKFPIIESAFVKATATDEFEPRMLLAHVATTMNANIVTLVKSCGGDQKNRRQKHNAGRFDANGADMKTLLSNYYAMHHMLRALADNYPSIQRRAVQKVTEFRQSVQKRHKKVVSDIGEFCVYILLAIWDGAVKWSDISNQFIDELLARNCRWLLKDNPELQPNKKWDVSRCYRIVNTFRGSAIGLKIIMLQVHFIAQAEAADATTDMVRTLRQPEQAQIARLVSETKEILAVSSFQDFFERMQVSISSNMQVEQKLLVAMECSANNKYHFPQKVRQPNRRYWANYMRCCCTRNPQTCLYQH